MIKIKKVFCFKTLPKVKRLSGVGIPALPVFMSVMHADPNVPVMYINKYDYTMLRNDGGDLLLRI